MISKHTKEVLDKSPIYGSGLYVAERYDRSGYLPEAELFRRGSKGIGGIECLGDNLACHFAVG
jgi:hypothetical protein